MNHSQPAVKVYSKTDVGRLRDHNEDNHYSDPQGQFFVVADGMGGHAAGEVASQLTVDEVKKRLGTERELLRSVGEGETKSKPLMTELLRKVGDLANTAVRTHATKNKATKGMGTTLEMLCLTQEGAWIGHVGDSRTYLVRPGKVQQLTTDHTVAEQLSDKKREQMAHMLEQWGSVLVEAIGAKANVNMQVVHRQVQEGDRLLLCSDGLYEYFPRSEEIGEILAMEGSERGLDRLVELALERGGRDNITGVLVEVASMPKPPRGASRDTNIELDQTLEVPPPKTAAEQGYGIAEAIALVRALPQDEADLVSEVLCKTLNSRDVELPPIIWDAAQKMKRIRNRVNSLQDEIADLETDRTDCRAEIAKLEAELDETTMVKERLVLALKPTTS